MNLGTNVKEYIWYKGDEVICLGTIEEAAEYFGISKKTAYNRTKPSYRKTHPGGIIGYVIEDDEEDEEEEMEHRVKDVIGKITTCTCGKTFDSSDFKGIRNHWETENAKEEAKNPPKTKRRPKDTDSLRDERRTVMMTTAEGKLLDKLARNSGMNCSDYIRHLIKEEFEFEQIVRIKKKKGG